MGHGNFDPVNPHRRDGRSRPARVSPRNEPQLGASFDRRPASADGAAGVPSGSVRSGARQPPRQVHPAGLSCLDCGSLTDLLDGYRPVESLHPSAECGCCGCRLATDVELGAASQPFVEIPQEASFDGCPAPEILSMDLAVRTRPIHLRSSETGHSRSGAFNLRLSAYPVPRQGRLR